MVPRIVSFLCEKWHLTNFPAASRGRLLLLHSRWPAPIGQHLPSFPVEIKYKSRRKDIFGNVTLLSFLLRAVSAAKCQGKKYPSNLEWIPDRPWCLQIYQRKPSPEKQNMKKVHYSTSRGTQIIRHSGIHDFPHFRWAVVHKRSPPFSADSELPFKLNFNRYKKLLTLLVSHKRWETLFVQAVWGWRRATPFDSSGKGRPGSQPPFTVTTLQSPSAYDIWPRPPATHVW